MLNITVLNPWIDCGLGTGKGVLSQGYWFDFSQVSGCCNSFHLAERHCPGGEGWVGLDQDLGNVIKILQQSVSLKHSQDAKNRSSSLLLQSNRFPSCIEVMREEVRSVPGCSISYRVSLKTELVLKRRGKLMTLIRRDEAHFYTPSLRSQVQSCMKSTEGLP